MQKNEQVLTNERAPDHRAGRGRPDPGPLRMAFTGQALVADVRDGSHASGQVGLYSWGNDDVVFGDIKLEPQRGLSTADLPAAVVDQGNVDAPSAWSLDEGALLQSRNIYTEPRDRDSLPKLGTFVRFGFPFWSDYEHRGDARHADRQRRDRADVPSRHPDRATTGSRWTRSGPTGGSSNASTGSSRCSGSRTSVRTCRCSRATASSPTAAGYARTSRASGRRSCSTCATGTTRRVRAAAYCWGARAPSSTHRRPPGQPPRASSAG